MPQLVKGGKYVFGWSRIMSNGLVIIPPEAIVEYKLKTGKEVILISGSKTSGGFVITAKSLLKRSAIGDMVLKNPELKNSYNKDGKITEYKNRKYGWTEIRILNSIKLSKQMLEAFGIRPGDELLSVRGSHVGIGMIVKGPLIEHAKKHPEVNHF
jgi:bifunctional DNA-binding transcriptional regulator/antitoxin component of YhaV-PrlF toxin-antitoxin module